MEPSPEAISSRMRSTVSGSNAARLFSVGSKRSVRVISPMSTVPSSSVACTTGTGQKVPMPMRTTRTSRPTIIRTHTARAPPVSHSMGSP